MITQSFQDIKSSFPDCCIAGKGLPDEHGYTRLKTGSATTGGKRNLTHRMVYRAFNGPIPENLVVMHTCDNRVCINPRHLVLGTNLDNMKDALNKGRLEVCGTKKFTKEQVLEILSSAEKATVLAARFGVNTSSIYNIRNNKSWKSVVSA